MRIIAIDPGYERLGIAIIDQSPKETLLYSSCFKTSAKLPFPERLREVGAELCRVMKEYQPESIAVERLFFTKNQKTAMAVAEVRGVILYEAARHRLSVYEYTPNQIKVAVAGHGQSDKKMVMKMVERLIAIPERQALDDEYDAIAVGLTCLATYRATKPSYIPSEVIHT